MAYDPTLPLNDGYLADAPAELRELFRALKEDKIVNAGKLKGYEPGNANGNIPLNNGTLNTNLNADLLDGHDSAYFSAATHTHSAATTSAAGFMTATQVTKLNGIATGAEVNQNAFSNVTVGSSTIQADGKTDTLTLAAGTGITLTADTTNDKVTIAGKNATTSAAGLMSAEDKTALNNVPSTYVKKSGDVMTGTLQLFTLKNANVNSPMFFIAGSTWDDGAWIRMDSKDGPWPSHIQIGSHGAETGQHATLIISGNDSKISADVPIQATKFIGAAASTSEAGLMSATDKTKLDSISVMSGASASAAGQQGLVPAPAAGDQDKCLLGNKTWSVPTHINIISASSNGARPVWFGYLGDNTRPVYNTNFQYNPATKRLDVGNINGFTIEKSVPADAVFTDTVYTHPTSAGNKHIPSGGLSGQILKYIAAGTAAWSSLSDANIFPKPTTASGVGQLYQCGTSTAKEFTLPSGGTWFYVMECFNANSTSIGTKVGTAAGGAKVTALNTTDTRSHCWAIRIA